SRRNAMMDQHAIRQITWAETPAYLHDLNRSCQLMRILTARFQPLYLHRYQIRKQAARAVQALWDPDVLAPDLHGLAVPAQPPPAVRERPTWDLGGLDMLRRWLRDYEVGGLAAASLERLLGRCRDHGVHVLLLGAPVSSVHRRFYTPAIDAAYRQHIAWLRQK